MYVNHPVYLDPQNGSLKLYRYMDFTKFVSLLLKKELYFCPVNKLKDPFEGTFPLKEIEYQKKHNRWDVLATGFREGRNTVFVNCWHYNEKESASMWKLYSQTGKGIAIQSTIPKLKESFQVCKSDIYIGKVIYIDYSKDTFYQGESDGYPSLNFGLPFIHKRNIFTDEREYRAIHINHDPKLSVNPYFQVDLNTLVDNIIVAPESEDWFCELIDNLLAQHLPGKNIIRSIYDQHPFS